MSDGTGSYGHSAHRLVSHASDDTPTGRHKDIDVQTLPRFSGLYIPLVTPFRRERVDHDALGALVRRLAADGVSGFVVGATTGEAGLLDDAERVAVLATVRAQTSLPVAMGAAGETALAVLHRMARASEQGAPAGFLVPPPAYLRPSQAALHRYFTQIADAAPAPLIVYDHPGRTGVRLELDTLLELAAHPNIVAVKDCGGRIEQTEALIHDGRLQVLCGDDDAWFVSRCLGAAGVIAASAHVRTELFVAFDRALARGELETARAAWRRLAPLTRALFDEPSPAPVKALLAAGGECENELRAPLLPASEALMARLVAMRDTLPARA